MTYKFNEFKSNSSDIFDVGYSVQIGGGNQVVVSSTSNYKTDRDIATTLGNFDAGKKNIASGSGHIAIIPVRFNLKDKKYQLLKDPEFAEPYTFQPETDTQPADRFVIFQAGPDIYPSSNDRCNDDFLEELNFSNNSFRLSLLETEKMTNNHQLKIVYNGVSSNYSNDKWICDDKKIKKAIASVNLLKLLETKKQLKDTTEIVIGPELATAQKSLQENPQAFFENLIEVFGDGPNATLFYANIGEILTNEQLIAFKNASVIKNINMTEEKIAKLYFEDLIKDSSNKTRTNTLIKFENLIKGGSLTPTQLSVLKNILKNEKDIDRVNHAKELGIKVKHLIKMENELNADISRVKRINVGGSFGKKFKLTLRDREDTTRKQKKFIKVQQMEPSMSFLGDKVVKDSFQGKQHESILIPDYIHMSKKTLNSLPINDTTREFAISDFAKETKEIFLGDIYSVSRPLNPELSNPKDKHIISQQLISALKQLHDEKIYHYDFKPDNVLLDKNGEKILVRITDLSTATKEIKGAGETTTYSYSPPEYFNFFKKNESNLFSYQERCDAWSILSREKHDVWALSLTLLSLQVGVELNELVEYDSEGSIVSSFKDQASIDNYIDNIDISEQYKKFFKKILIYDPLNRPDLNTIEKEFQKIALEKEKSQSQQNIPDITLLQQNTSTDSTESIKPVVTKETDLSIPNKLAMAKPIALELLLPDKVQKLKLSMENEKRHFNELRRTNLNNKNKIADYTDKLKQLRRKEKIEQSSKEYVSLQEEISKLNSLKEKASAKLQKDRELQELSLEHFKKLEYSYQQAFKRLEQLKLSQQKTPKLATKFSKQKENKLQKQKERPPFRIGQY